MLLRKINAGLSLLSTFLLMDHAIFNAVWMLSMGSIAKNMNSMPWILFGVMVLHAFISIDFAISGIVNSSGHKYKKYVKLNISTIVQRISGFLLMILTLLHIAGTMGYIHPPKIVHAINPPLFFAIALTHAAVSTSKALVTLGIGNAKFVKIADIAVKVLCGLTLVADVVGFFLYLW